MKIMIFLSCTLSYLYMNMTHPMMFVVIILAQSLIICITSWMLMKSSWFSFIIFLIFLGGLMVLFIYITSLASNEMLYPMEMKLLLKTFLMTSLAYILATLLSQETPSQISINLNKFFYEMMNYNYLLMVMFAMIYLLFTLIVVVKIANQSNAPMKSMI